jgi:hypothetical protein
MKHELADHLWGVLALGCAFTVFFAAMLDEARDMSPVQSSLAEVAP